MRGNVNRWHERVLGCDFHADHYVVAASDRGPAPIQENRAVVLACHIAIRVEIEACDEAIAAHEKLQIRPQIGSSVQFLDLPVWSRLRKSEYRHKVFLHQSWSFYQLPLCASLH